MTDTHKPSWAATIWWTPDGWHCYCPGPNGTHHIINFPLDQAASMLEMLRHRTSDSKLGTSGDKTKWQLGFLRQKVKPKKAEIPSQFTPEQQTSARDVLRKLGLA